MPPVVPMHHNVRAQMLHHIPIAQRRLLHHPGYATDAAQHLRPLGIGHRGKALVPRHGLVGQHAHHQPPQGGRLAQDGKVPRMQHVAGEGHVHRAAAALLHQAAHGLQLLGGVHLGTQQRAHVQGRQVHPLRHLAQGLFRIAAGFAPLAVFADFVQPDVPVLLAEHIHGLGHQHLVEILHAYLQDAPVPDHRLEVLLQDLLPGADRHAAALRLQRGLQHLAVKHQIAVEQQDVVVPQLLPGAINGVDIVGLVIDGVMDKGDVPRQGGAVVHQLSGKPACGHNHPGHAIGVQQPQLAADDGLVGQQLGHALGILAGQVAHAASHAGIQDQRLHDTVVLAFWLAGIRLIVRSPALPCQVRHTRMREIPLFSAYRISPVCPRLRLAQTGEFLYNRGSNMRRRGS